MIKTLLIALLIVPSVYAARDGAAIAKELNINPKERLKRQWEYVYKRERMLEQYGILKLDEQEREILKQYLFENGADGDKADVAGSF